MSWISTMSILFPMLLSLVGGLMVSAEGGGNVSTSATDPKVIQEGCAIKIETTENVSWALPRQPIDLVILQDTSGSFANTIGNVQSALREVTTPVALKDYDEKNPRLVFTGDEKTTDRVMVATFQGIDQIRYYSATTASDHATLSGVSQVGGAGKVYTYGNSGLLTNNTQVQNFINSFSVGGGTPTVPAIEDTLARYEAAKKLGGGMQNNRKTVFLLITDGVANGYRETNDGNVYFDSSLKRRDSFAAVHKINNLEVTNDYLKRSKEVEAAGNKIKQAIGTTGTVVVGFWEDVASFEKITQYADGYRGDFTGYNFNTNGDKRSVQSVFHSALESVASPAKEINGESVSFYVNEQSDAKVFADKILKAVTAAFVKENVSGEFEVTEGYKVGSVTINGKKVVDKVKDEAKEIPGTVKQDGRKVTISVPESVFNPGNNKFDYELKRTEEAENLDEADETEPPADYKPQQVERKVGQLVGTFKVGDYESAKIGSKEPTSVTVNDLKYCYPRVTKDVKDKDTSNDKNGDEGKGGFIAQDPLLVNVDPSKTIKRSSYAATLTEEGETFTYAVDYNMYNVALEMKQNVMFVDALDYRVKYIDAKVTDEKGTVLPDFKVSTKATVDSKGKSNTTVIATVPEKAGEKTATVNEGNYGGHKFKKYRLVITAEIKDEYKLEKNATEYYKMMQENEGRGFANQASIVWNGKTDDPIDSTAKVRRSNNVFVTPPLDTDITKKVTQTLDPKTKGSEHLDLPAVDDEYYYTIESTWPGLFDEYIIEDILVPELESLNAAGEDTVYVNGKESTVLKKYLKVDAANSQRVYFELNKKELSRTELLRINREIAKLNEGNDGPAKIKLGIKAKIRENADLSKYRENGNGQVKVPNDATVKLNNKSKTSKKVTVTPPGLPPKPEKTVDKKASLSLDAMEQVFTYEVKATVPKEVTGFTKFEISDDLEDILTITETKVTVGGKTDASVVVTTAAAANANATTKGLVVASLPKDKIAAYKGQEMVLTIKARIKEGVTSEELAKYVDNTIPNKATLKVGDKPNQSEDTENVPVTPPGETPTPKKTVDEQASLDLTGLNQEFTYRVKATVPQNVTGFTKFDISDDLEDILTVTGTSATVDGQSDAAVKVTSVDAANTANGKVVASLPADKIADYKGKEIVLTIKARIKAGVTSAELAKYVSTDNTSGSIPNKAKLTVGDKPEQSKDSNEVPVTPPGETPTVEKKINGSETKAVVLPESNYTYNITSTLPSDITRYKAYSIVDDLDDNLAI
ncbi:isopeptide-forming domain-containing fimbrial protein, partial [Streptococcus gallinaceus]